MLHGEPHSAFLSLGELVGCSFEHYPNVRTWYANVGRHPSVERANRTFKGFAASLANQDFVELS
jgi:glutathione S-transferase